jgi:hypothetical protein
MVSHDKAIVVIANTKSESLIEPTDDEVVYVFPHNITEFELVDEIKHLREFYAEVVLPISWPAHIRESVIRGALCQEKAQCNMFCKYFNKKGCIQYATE